MLFTNPPIRITTIPFFDLLAFSRNQNQKKNKPNPLPFPNANNKTHHLRHRQIFIVLLCGVREM